MSKPTVDRAEPGIHPSLEYIRAAEASLKALTAENSPNHRQQSEEKRDYDRIQDLLRNCDSDRSHDEA